MNQLYRQEEASQDPLCQSPQAPAGAPQLIGAYLSCSLHYKNTKMIMRCGSNESIVLKKKIKITVPSAPCCLLISLFKNVLPNGFLE